nr:unnamed protein product [Digitaria exilis]
MSAAAGTLCVEAESGSRGGPCPPPPGEVADEGTDLISRLPDDLLGEIINPPPHQGRRPHPGALPPVAPSLARRPPQPRGRRRAPQRGKPCGAIAGALRGHGGRVRRVSLAWRGYCHPFPELDCVLRSPMLVNLHEFDLLHAPWQPWVETHSQRIPHSVLSSSSTLRVLRIWSNSSEKLQFPMESARTLSFPCLKQLTLSDVNLSESTLHGPCLEQLTLSSVNLSESTLHDLLSGSPVLVSLVLAGNTGLGSRLHIRSLEIGAS